MPDSLRLLFRNLNPKDGVGGFKPLLDLELFFGSTQLKASGLIDSGASISVLPYQLGLELGAKWNDQHWSLTLSGNLARLEARAILLHAKVGEFNSVPLAFAWTDSNNVPLILGQMNFFLQFEICFFRAQLAFEIRPAQTQSDIEE